MSLRLDVLGGSTLINSVWRGVAMVAVLAGVVSCGGAVDPSEDLNGLPPETIRFTVDGSVHTAPAIGFSMASPNAIFKLSVTGFNADGWKIVVNSPTGSVGTEQAPYVGIALGEPGSASTLNWTTNPEKGATGTITILTLVDNHARGTFEGALVPLESGVGAKRVERGAFDVTLRPYECLFGDC